MIEKARVCHAVHRYAEAHNKYMKYYLIILSIMSYVLGYE